MNKRIISCDLGGTKCAAGVVEYQPDTRRLTCTQRTALRIAEFGSLAELLHQLESLFGFTLQEADAICIGAAGQYNGEELIYAGAYPYPMNFAALAREQNWPRFAIVHDYTPIVCATFTDYMQQPDNIQWLNNATADIYGRRVAFGLGTGLGMKDGVLFPDGNFWLGKNEVGHIGITLPPHANALRLKQHYALMQFLEKETPLTFEKILSGPGTVRLYRFFYPNEKDITPAEIWALLPTGKIDEMLDAFAFYLGLFIGTLQLIFMPEGGIYATGGVTLHYLDVFKQPAFQEGLHCSPAYLAQREKMPLGILCNQEHAILGGGYYALKRLLPENITSINRPHLLPPLQETGSGEA